MRRLGTLLATAAVLAGCATGPGPYEQQAQGYYAACLAGDPVACSTYRFALPLVQAERQQRQAQNDAVAAGVAGVIVGGLLGAALGSTGPGRHYHPHRGRW